MQSFMPSVSTYSTQIDNLILLIFWTMAFWFVAGQGVIIYFLYKFRRQANVPTQYVTGEKKEHLRWIKWPHFLLLACDIVIVVLSTITWYNVKQRLPEADAKVKVVSQQWAWTFVHAGADGQLDTEDDIAKVDELHIEVNKVYHYLLTSKDVLHSFSVPAFRLKQDAVPGREITGWFKATAPGQHDIQCAEICGIGHGIMGARLFIETAEEHQKWIAANSPSSPIKLGSK